MLRLCQLQSRDDVRPIAAIRGRASVPWSPSVIVTERGGSLPDAATTTAVTRRAQEDGLIPLSCGTTADTIGTEVQANFCPRGGVPASKRAFTVWGHGNASLSRGSGLFVPPTGIAENHHFNPPDGSPEFCFSAGEYELKVFAEVVSDSRPKELCSVHLSVSTDALPNPLGDKAAIWFDWDPNKRQYHAHVETRSDPIGLGR